MKSAVVLAISCTAALASCFVSEGDCVSNGVVVEPCVVNAKAGQTIILRAAVTGAPSEPIDWFLPASAASAFAVTATDNELTLVSLQNIPSSFPIQASSRTDPLTYGGSVVGVRSASFSSQAPPFVVFGGDFPAGNTFGATAVGGNLYYVAYANVAPAPLPAPGSSLGPPPSANFFVQQYDLATNTLLADIPGQFSAFSGLLSTTPIVPNVAADCLGNGYWIDVAGSGFPNYVLRKLAPGASAPIERALGAFNPMVFQAFSVACDGAIYFVGQPVGFNAPELFRLDSFTGPIVRVRTIPVFLPLDMGSLAIDAQGRILVGDDNVDGEPSVLRLVVDPDAVGGPLAVVDPTFASASDLFGATDVTSDAAGVVYAALDRGDGTARIGALNEIGDEIYSIDTYAFFCPSACSVPLCDTQIPFTRILSLAAGPSGALRVFDGPDTSNLPTECQEAVRFVLIDPD